MGIPSFVVAALYFGGMGLVFVGERLVGAGSFRALTAVGVALVVVALALRAARAVGAGRRGREDVRTVEATLLGLGALGVVALALYFVQSDLASSLLGGKTLERASPRVAGVVGALWPAVWVAAAAPLLLAELAYGSVARSPRLEVGRVRDAMLSGLGLAGALVFAFGASYVASERDKKVDLSYFRTARPGEATRKIVRALDKPVEVALFFPPGNEVREELSSYFGDLAAESKQVQVKSYDHAADPAAARDLGVSGNGTVVIGRDKRREQIAFSLELEGARSQLQNLDKEVQKRLLQVARTGRTVYLVTGHGERTTEPQGDTDKRFTIRGLREGMIEQGYDVKTLGAAEGLAVEVPADAAMLLLIGPTKPLLAEEAQAINRYVDKGGRLLVALDPDGGQDLKEVLAPLGVKYVPTTLANDQVFFPRTHTPSDRSLLILGSYSSHPSVTTLGHLGTRAPILMLGAGSIEQVMPPPKDTTVSFTVHTHAATWADANGNFQPDPNEPRKVFEVAAAVSRSHPAPTDPHVAVPAQDKPSGPESRLLLVADSDLFADGVLGAGANVYFVLDGMKWLLGDESIAGEIASEADVPITHSQKQDVLWFYSSIFLAPALVLGVGFVVTRRRRRAARPSASSSRGTDKRAA